MEKVRCLKFPSRSGPCTRVFFDGVYDARDFAKIAPDKFSINAIEYVNQFYADTLSDKLGRELRHEKVIEIDLSVMNYLPVLYLACCNQAFIDGFFG